MNRLLILSCSKAKRADPGDLPAVDRYDGPLFRVLRRYLRLHPSAPPEVRILSAEFGLISADTPIPDYDRRMTPRRVRELQASVADALEPIGRAMEAAALIDDPVLVVLGKDYLPALAGYDGPGATALRSRVAPGGLGGKQSVLHDWLYGAPPKASARARQPRLRGSARLRGVTVAMSAAEVLEKTRQALGQDETASARYQSWYVPLGEMRVAPKWLASQVTGLPVCAFTTGEARMLLARLGIESRRP
jgi:hypothetical protein